MRSRQKIMDATLTLIEQEGYAGVNIAAVAAAAGVTRQTVYSNFGSYDELVSQAVTGVAIEVLTRIQASIAELPDACSYLVEFLVQARSEIRAHRVLADVIWSNENNLMFADDVMSKATAIAVPLLAPVIERDPRLAAVIDELIELWARIGISALLFDSDATRADDGLRRLLTSWLQPILTALTGG
ncbi:TetR family transcriptional regulator [Jatrophihabitans sp. GAS493]|uniref:TetR/AcrR family transcriptional regulator n=1 Tax=Jatrophihabitans sp. GAS493 TaxID=1907575 RepID=UPI000BC0193C|nr:TetR/AcrR family transcriptional regulator [Jatrophihabitans sp. GAS493]SOD72254.1 TetR family transcriptional regulator [Jatrophihabitans sp. GAS493]